MSTSEEKNCSEGWKAYRRKNYKANRKKQSNVNIECIKGCSFCRGTHHWIVGYNLNMHISKTYEYLCNLKKFEEQIRSWINNVCE